MRYILLIFIMLMIALGVSSVCTQQKRKAVFIDKDNISESCFKDCRTIVFFKYIGKAVYLESDKELFFYPQIDSLLSRFDNLKVQINSSSLPVINAYFFQNKLTIIMSKEQLNLNKYGPLEIVQ